MDDFILINEIEKRGQLYDHSDPKYKDKRQRDAGWMEGCFGGSWDNW